jgi:glycosyltransferase involved in cell wall biosynthesis
MARVLILGGLPVSLVNFRGALLRALTRSGGEVIASSAPAPADVIQSLHSWGVVFKSIPVERTGLNPLSDLKLCLAIAKLMAAEEPDLVLAYTAKPVIFGGIAAKLTGNSNFYAMITGLGYAFSAQTFKQRFLGSIVRILYRFALTKAKGVFFQNPDDEQFFREKKLIPANVNAIRINGSGVDLDKFQPAPLPSEPVFALIARLIADKGLREFCSAAKNLKKKHPQTRFLLAGALDANPNSIQKDELQRWIDEGIIEFHRWLTDVRPFLSQTQVYVLPSYREGTPRSVLEAMAMGRPIITTDTPGCRETVVDGQNGFLVPPRDSLALEQAMERFILDPTLAPRMGAASLEIARDKYDVNKVNAVIMKAMGLDSLPAAFSAPTEGRS